MIRMLGRSVISGLRAQIDAVCAASDKSEASEPPCPRYLGADTYMWRAFLSSSECLFLYFFSIQTIDENLHALQCLRLPVGHVHELGDRMVF